MEMPNEVALIGVSFLVGVIVGFVFWLYAMFQPLDYFNKEDTDANNK